MAKVSKREVERKKFNDKVNRLRRSGIPEEHLPTKITKESVKKLSYKEIQQMNSKLKKDYLTGSNIFTGTKQDGTSVTYTKAQLDIANIKIKAENRDRTRRRKEIAEKEVYYARQPEMKGKNGKAMNKFVQEYAGQRKEMADLTRLGLLDVREITEANTEGNVDIYTKIHSADSKFDRNQAELYKENILDSLAWSLGGEHGEELLDALRDTDAEILLDMYYSSNELDIADWYVKTGDAYDEISNVVEQNAFALQAFAKRAAATGKYTKSQYGAISDIYSRLYESEAHEYISPNRAEYDRRRMRVETKSS